MKQIFTIEARGETDAALQVLSIRLGLQHFGFAISSRLTNELLQLTWYTGEHIGVAELQEMYIQHGELRSSFYSTLIGYDHFRSLLLPVTGIFTENNPRVLLDTMYGSNGKDAVISENIAGWQIQNVYAVPAEIQEWINRHFPSGQYWHNYSVGIRHIDMANQEGSLLVDFRTQDFTVIAGKAGKLLLAQTFSYATPADVVYYLLRICGEFSLSQQTVALALSGLVEKESNLYRELAHYFLEIQFREPGWQVSVQHEFPSHFFTSLNDLAVCAS